MYFIVFIYKTQRGFFTLPDFVVCVFRTLIETLLLEHYPGEITTLTVC